MNEKLFNEMVTNDFEELSSFIEKKDFDSIEFINKVLELSNSLAMFHQEIMGWDYVDKTDRGEQVQKREQIERMVAIEPQAVLNCPMYSA